MHLGTKGNFEVARKVAPPLQQIELYGRSNVWTKFSRSQN